MTASRTTPKLVFRIGLGRSGSGKILDPDTTWFTDVNKAVEQYEKTKKPIFVQVSKGKYWNITPGKLYRLANEINKCKPT